MRCNSCLIEKPYSGFSACEKCDTQVELNSWQPGEASRPEKFQSYLVHSILAMLFCFPPFGIVALINAVIAWVRYGDAKYEEAYARAEEAKGWCITSLVCGVVCLILWRILS